jgi:hypothetical protein
MSEQIKESLSKNPDAPKGISLTVNIVEPELEKFLCFLESLHVSRDHLYELLSKAKRWVEVSDHRFFTGLLSSPPGAQTHLSVNGASLLFQDTDHKAR